MKNTPTALILCGGKGERLRPLTESIPKPLVELNGRPILSYLLDHIQKFGITEIVIAAGYKAEKIHDFFKHQHLNLNVKIVDSGDVDIIKRIQACSPYLHGEFIMFYGDTLADVNLDTLQQFHHNHSSPATITLWPLKSQFGLAELDNKGFVSSFREKPTLDQWINIGHFYFDQENLKSMEIYSSFVDYLEYVTREKKLMGFKHLGVHITVNTLRELEEAENNIHEFEREN